MATTYLSATGRSKDYYKVMAAEREKRWNVKLYGSIGFMRRELATSVEWVNVFDETEVHGSVDSIITKYTELFGKRVYKLENDGTELMVWLSL